MHALVCVVGVIAGNIALFTAASIRSWAHRHVWEAVQEYQCGTEAATRMASCKVLCDARQVQLTSTACKLRAHRQRAVMIRSAHEINRISSVRGECLSVGSHTMLSLRRNSNGSTRHARVDKRSSRPSICFKMVFAHTSSKTPCFTCRLLCAGSGTLTRPNSYMYYSPG